MTDIQASAAISPSWYADPRDPSLERWWDGRGWTDYTRGNLHLDGASEAPEEVARIAAAQEAAAAAQRIPATPGRVSGFVLSLLALLIGGLFYVGIPLSILGIVLSTTAFRRIAPGARGRGLTVAGQVIGWVALAGILYIVLQRIAGVA